MHRRDRRAGITLIEILIVSAIIALIGGISYPSIVAGVDSMRLRSASDQVVAFVTQAMDQAQRKQLPVEFRVAPKLNRLAAHSMDSTFDKVLVIDDPVHLVSAQGGEDERRFVLFPGGTPPAVRIELETKDKRRRTVTVDPLTGFAEAK